jgi:hypothetical protein
MIVTVTSKKPVFTVNMMIITLYFQKKVPKSIQDDTDVPLQVCCMGMTSNTDKALLHREQCVAQA